MEDGDRVAGAFDEQDSGGRTASGPEPEAAADFAGAGAGADEFGAGDGALGVAADEDCVAAGVGVEQAVVAAVGEQAEVEAAGGVQEGANGRPAAGDGREGAGPRFEEFDGGGEAGAGRMHDEIDRPPPPRPWAWSKKRVAQSASTEPGRCQRRRWWGPGR